MVYQLRRGTVIFAMSFSTTNRGTAQHWFHSFQKLWLMRSIDSQTFDSHRPKELTLLNLLFKLICHVLELISHCSVIHVFNRIVKKEERKGILKWWTVSLRWQTKCSWRYQKKYDYEQHTSNCPCWWLISFQRLFGRITFNRPFVTLGQKKKIASLKMVIYLLFLQVLLLLSSLKKQRGFATSFRVLSRQEREMGIFCSFLNLVRPQ